MDGGAASLVFLSIRVCNNKNTRLAHKASKHVTNGNWLWAGSSTGSFVQTQYGYRQHPESHVPGPKQLGVSEIVCQYVGSWHESTVIWPEAMGEGVGEGVGRGVGEGVGGGVGETGEELGESEGTVETEGATGAMGTTGAGVGGVGAGVGGTMMETGGPEESARFTGAGVGCTLF
mmetsp:Transcript_5526/g.12245  ORF Transcript_5526/g.12245 Transcript_5526/m.12245 type:complete len:175 (-) Transcript_5526:228-752(-)